MIYSHTLYDNQTESVQTTTLHNGIRIMTEHVPTVESVAIGIWVNAGTRDEQTETAGIAHFIEHLLFRRTSKRSSAALATAFEDLGAYANAFTTKEHTCVYARSLKQYTRQTLSLLAEVIKYPVFHIKDIEKERSVIIEEIRTYEEDPEELIFDEGELLLFGKHPLGKPIAGTVESITSIERNQILDFYNHHYLPEQIIVSIAGNIHHESIVEYCTKLFEGFTTAYPTKTKRRIKPHAIKPKNITLERDFQQSHILFGTRTPGVKSQERYALSVFNTLLGDGMSSRLYQKVREKSGLAYSIYSTLQLLSDCGTLAIYVGLDKKNVEKLKDVVHETLLNLQTELCSPKELKRMKLQVSSGIVMSLESMEARMTAMAKSMLENNSYEDVNTSLQYVEKVDAEDIRQCANLLTPDKLSSVIFYPEVLQATQR